MGFIYKITSPTGRMYVGQTKHIQRRINLYKYKTKNDAGWKNAKVMNSIKKYGWDSHKFEILEECEDEKLSEREMFWIGELKTFWLDNPHHMNMSRGGEKGAKPWMYDEDRRQKQAKRFSGEGNPFFGKHHSEEFKERKSKQVSEYNKKIGWRIPEWGAKKGRDVVRRSVLCYDKNGDFVKEFKCGSDAAQEFGFVHSCISMCCNLKQSHVGGYVFRYKEDGYPLKIEVGVLKEKDVKKKVVLIRRHMKSKTFKSAAEASKETGVPTTTIRRACAYNNGRPIRNGMIFKYK